MKKLNSYISILLFGLCTLSGLSQDNLQPNVLLIITDDQGYGDLGFHGNPYIQTPVLDRFASNSIRFNNFYVSPVCAPTRASLMTGRYSLRTGIRDTYNGGAIMASNEVTIAEMLKKAEYKTGIFGKWHLGDNYPSRPSDQGFDESLIHLAGGMGQVGDFTTYFQRDSSYFDPILWHNNEKEKYEGYCSDIFTKGAIEFIESNRNEPFFCYLSFNAPHTPLQVPDSYYQKYKDIDPTDPFSEKNDNDQMSEKDKEDARKVYAMVSNIDDNIGKLLLKLDQLELAENTIVIFMTDNGPQQNRYIAGMKGRKGSVYQGGVRVPFYLRYPQLSDTNAKIDVAAAHIDLLPTLADMCNVHAPVDRQIDGKSLAPLLTGKSVDWTERSLFFYWTRRYPELYRNIALQMKGHKLVGNADYDAPIDQFALYNIHEDPQEKSNLIDEEPDRAKHLKKQMDSMYYELIQSKNLTYPPRIVIGHESENPIVLNRNDAGGERGIWSQEEIYGKWRVSIAEGNYNIRFKFIEPVESGGRLFLETGSVINQKDFTKTEGDVLEMKNIFLPEMDGDLIPFYTINGKRIFPFWVELLKLD